jgi:hypothetical protein
MGFVPRSGEKFFTDKLDRLIGIFLAIDQERYEQDGVETYSIPLMTDKEEGTFVCLKVNTEGPYYSYKPYLPPLESQRKPCPNYDERMAERHDLIAYRDETVKTLSHVEMEEALEVVLSGDKQSTQVLTVKADSVETGPPETETTGSGMPHMIPQVERNVVQPSTVELKIGVPVVHPVAVEDEEPEDASPTDPIFAAPTCFGKGYDEANPVCAMSCEKWNTACSLAVVANITEGE